MENRENKNNMTGYFLNFLDLALIAVCAALFINLIDDYSNWNVLQFAVSIMVTIFSMSSTANRWERGRQVFVKILVLGMFVGMYLFGPQKCAVDHAAIDLLADNLTLKSDSYIANHYSDFETDSLGAYNIISGFHIKIIDTLLSQNEQQLKGCQSTYKENLLQKSKKILIDYFKTEEMKTKLCAEINNILEIKRPELIEPLLMNYGIDLDAELLQYEGSNMASLNWGPLIKFLDGITRNGLNHHIRFRHIRKIARNSKEKKISMIEFVNYQ